MILSEREVVREILGDLVVQYPAEREDEMDELALIREIDAATHGIPPVSGAIIDERREGP